MLDKFCAEVLGTFVFLSIIITSVHSTDQSSSGVVWLKIGLALAISILLVGVVSGAHLNPAVSFMFYLNNDINIEGFGVYVIAQILGATLAYYYYTFLKNSYGKSFK